MTKIQMLAFRTCIQFTLATLFLFIWIFKMSTQPVKGAVRYVKPLLSVDKDESRRRVLSLYKAWYRNLPNIIVTYLLPLTARESRTILKKEFMKNKNITDIRVIDMLVIKGQMELKETLKAWKQKCHVMYFVKDTQVPKPSSFLSKFLAGVD